MDGPVGKEGVAVAWAFELAITYRTNDVDDRHSLAIFPGAK